MKEIKGMEEGIKILKNQNKTNFFSVSLDLKTFSALSTFLTTNKE